MKPGEGSIGVAMAGALAASLLGLLATWLVLGPPAEELAVMGIALVATSVGGLVVAALTPQALGGLSVRSQLTLFALTALLVVVANIVVAALLMFLSGHDLKLLIILCGFAFLATLGPAHLMGRTLSARVESLQRAAQRIAGGELGARVDLAGRDDLARVEADFNRMAAALEEATRRRESLEEARRHLFAAISHDLRTPLASIRAMVEALSDGVVSDVDTSHRYLATISGEIQRLSLLIDDLFELTTIDSGELRLRLELLRVEDVVAEVMDVFRPQTERAGIRLEFDASGRTPPVRADPQRISRVLYNLLQNAIRHTPQDGTISLRTAVLEGLVEVVVSDSGDGIPAEDIPFVFERFYRGDKARSRDGGSGLGLSIARGIVEAHGGKIWIEPAKGSGASVAFALPTAG